MKHYSCFCQLILLAGIFLSSYSAQGLAKIEGPQAKTWEVLNEAEGITVFRSKESQEKVFTFRGAGIVEAPIPKLIALMSDASRLPQWVYHCEESELVERNFKESDRGSDYSNYYQVFYAVTSVPWPLNPRDYVLKAQISYQSIPNNKWPKVTIAMHSLEHPNKPIKAGRVRMPVMESHIVMTPEGQKGEKTLVDFSVTSDPGGNIPAWITKLASRDIPRKTLLNLRQLAKSSDYNKEFEELVLYHYHQIKP